MCEARKDEITVSGDEVRELCDMVDDLIAYRRVQKLLAEAGTDASFLEPCTRRACERLEQLSNRMQERN
ncbi:hypothetical protein PQQ64_30135 [Paraburkholderia graminis]|uniref:hypothetical protein n=1 Tax=Paraburkholderia graminis TaxID=60548 RepID=UPI0038BBC886